MRVYLMANPFRNFNRQMLIGLHQQDSKFLATKSCKYIALAHLGLDQSGNFLKYQIANMMAINIVKLLEVIDIQKETTQSSILS